MPVRDSLIGRRVRRLEDPALVSGRGSYAGDPRLPGLSHLAVFRSPFGRARVGEPDLERARRAPGVLAAWTAADLPELAAGMADSVPRGLVAHPRPVLGSGEARYQGEPLAVVVAETAYQAADALDLVELSLEPLPPVTGLEAAAAPGAELVHAELESNLAGTVRNGFGDVTAAFAGAPVSVAIDLRVGRVAGGYLEPRVVTGAFESGRLTLWASTQWTFGVRDRVAALLGLEKESVRVLATDVGGGFGPKGDPYPEEALVAAATVRLRRPVRWTASRTEDTLATAHAHGTRLELELAAEADGRLRGVRGRITHDAGAYTASGAGLGEIMISHLVSAYRLPAAEVEVRVVHTNTVPTGFVRGGSRPVGNFAVERLLDALARRLGLDPAELRRRNLVRPEEMPYDTGLPSGRATVVYDGGDYPRLLDTVLEALKDVPEGPRPDGRVAGRGVVCAVESSGFGRREPARARLERDGVARLYVGSTPQGQGHRTMAAQVFAERLGWPLERVEVTAGDSAVVDWALLTAGSRSAVQVGNAASLAGAGLRRRLLEQAAEVLEADPADLVLEDGKIAVRGSPARSLDALEAVPEVGLEVSEHFDPAAPLTYPSSCHGAVVVLDPETGAVEVERYVMAHDSGRAVNPTLVEGQMHGGFAHGLGYALFEEAVYAEDGSLTTASFLDYAIPGAPEVPVPELHRFESATAANREGFRGAGESGTVPVPGAIASAVERALSHLNPEAVVDRLPLTPERLLKLARPGAGGVLAD